MSRKHTRFSLFSSLVAVALVLPMLAAQAYGQRGRGMSRFMTNARLIKLDRIQKELELDEDQIAALESSDGDREAGGESEERPNWRELSAEQRTAYLEKLRAARENRASAEEDKINDVLLPHQLRRLEQIKVQLLGAAALDNDTVAEELKLTDETREEMKQAVSERTQEMREVMREAFMSGDRDAIQGTMAEMRESIEEAMMDTLSDEQKAKLKELKGPPISFTPEELMGDFFGGMRGDRGGRDRGGRDRGGRERRGRDRESRDSDSESQSESDG